MEKLKTFLSAIKASVVLSALAVLLVGIGVGWLMGNRRQNEILENEPPERIAPANGASSAQKRPVRDSVRAPESGFNPEFVKIAVTALSDVDDTVPISGKLAVDAQHVHLVSSRVAGRLDRIHVFEGAKVARGQAIAELFSPDWISAQNEYLLAKNAVRALLATAQKDLIDEAKFTEQSVITRMKVLGASEADIAQLDKTGRVSTHLPLRAPIAGTIVKRNMDPGAFLDTGADFMTVSDTSTIWFVGNFYEKDYAKVAIGQTLELSVAALPGQTFKGTVNYIGTTVDPVTHVLPVRCTVDNASGALKPELFATAQLITATHRAVVVPKSAIVSIQKNAFVIVEAEKNLYRRVPVSTQILSDGRIAVMTGLSGNERIVTEGATLVNEAIDRD